MKVLIAEDQFETRRLLVDLLRSWEYEPVTVPDGTAALQVLRSGEAPPLALLDWVMPGMDGMEVCQKVRQQVDRPYPYLILVTGAGGRDEMLTALRVGADEFLTKPIDPEELWARLNAGRRIIDLQHRLLAAQQELWERASRDALTGLWNRAAILDRLERELARSRREGRPVGIALADLDHFKRINDSFGHLAGDQVLGETARRLLSVVRPYDAVGRYGGEEFLIVFPGCNELAALALAERLRGHLASEPMDLESGPITVTLSVGVASWKPTSCLSSVDLFRVADQALYRAKEAGRNRAVLGQRCGVTADRAAGCP